MEHAIFLAKIFGPVLTLLGFFVLFRAEDVLKLWGSIKTNPVVMYLAGIINLLIGFTILAMYNEWSMHLPVFVTLLGYVAVIRGILVLFWTDAAKHWSEKFMKTTSTLRAIGFLPLIWGILLLWLGFCCI
jgi:hypothetical protein